MARVLVVGAGITGALTAALLRREFANVQISVWEKARGPGKTVLCIFVLFGFCTLFPSSFHTCLIK